MGKNNGNFDAATAPLPEELRTRDFIKAWFEWCDYRLANRKKISRQACALQLKKLAKFGPQIAIAAIERSIENDWQGLFPERVGGMIAGRISAAAPHFSGLKSWAEQNRDNLHREYGT